MSIRVFDPASTGSFRETSLEEACQDGKGHVLWLDLLSPSRDELQAIGAAQGFHPLAIEDAAKRRQRPKVDVYGDHIFTVMYALEAQPDGTTPTPHEVALFANDHVVVTVRTEDITELNTAASRWSERRSAHDDKLALMLVYTITDSVVDGYFPCMDALAEGIEDLEMRMFANQRDSDTLEEIFRLKRGLLELRRVIAPTRDVFNVFVRRELPFFGEESVFYFQDVYDHIIRITDTIDADRDVLSSAIDVHLSLASNRMNQTVRTLTVASIMLMSVTLVAGIYGMNFVNIPELHWHYGYFMALALMALIAGGELALFRRMKWW